MNNLEGLIKSLYSGVRLNGEVMALIGFIELGDQLAVEMVKYYTSFEESSVKASFKEIVQDMAKYGLLARGEAKFVLVHNHPNGSERASMEDRKLKERLDMVAEFIGVNFVGSYIYIEGREKLVDIVGITEVRERPVDKLFPNKVAVSNNLFLNDGEFRYPEMDILVEYREYEEEKRRKDWYGKQLSGMVLDNELLVEGGSKLGLVILDEENKVKDIIDTNDFVGIEEDEESAEMCLSKKKVSFLLEDSERYLLYDMRTDADLEEIRVSKREDGVALDVVIITQLMGIMGYPINYFMR